MPKGVIFITSFERKENRYRRRKVKRELKRLEKIKNYDSFDYVFSYSMLYNSYKRCVRGIGWKTRTQRFKIFSPLEVYRNYESLHDGTFHRDPFFEFIINDKGRERHIKSVSLRERNVQWGLCDKSLSPIMKRTFIYDNGATLKNKGYSFSLNRLKCHLHKYYRKFGNDRYILLFDFSKFFDNISHVLIKNLINNTYSDSRIIKLLYHFIDAYGDVGMGLGSPISQVLALASANKLDHYMKEKLKIKYYGRYMDDGYIIHKDKKFLQKCLSDMIDICKSLHINLNKKKTKICKLNTGFVYLKVRFYLLYSGKVLCKICKKSITRMRRKLKIFRILVKYKKLTVDDVIESLTSWVAHAKNFYSHNSVKSILYLFSSLFGHRKNIYKLIHA